MFLWILFSIRIENVFPPETRRLLFYTLPRSVNLHVYKYIKRLLEAGRGGICVRSI